MSRMSISMCENDGVPSVRMMSRAAAASDTRSDQLEAAGGDHPLEHLLSAGLVERHPRGPNRLEPVEVAIDAEDAQTPVGEAQRQRQANPPQPNNRDIGTHREENSSGRIRNAQVRINWNLQ